MSLSREDINKADDSELLRVEVPKWGGAVYIRVMTVGERDAHELEQLAMQKKGEATMDNFRSRFLARCLCDESGALLFPGEEGVADLSKKSVAVCHNLWKEAMRHNALTQEEVDVIAGESTPDQS